jgi:hypothetical protein
MRRNEVKMGYEKKQDPKFVLKLNFTKITQET